MLLALAMMGAASVAWADPAHDWPTYHHDFARTGRDDTQAATAQITPDWSASGLDGAVYAEPHIVGNLVLVATEGATVYALDADTGTPLWITNLGDPVPASDLPCGNINPVGITGTPVADAAAGTLYVTTFLRDATVGDHHELVALRLADGGVIWRRGIDPPGGNPLAQGQRGAMAISSGRVYMPFGGRAGDCGDYHGWVVGLPADGTGSPITFQVPTTRQGGIWTPSGVAVDSGGNLYVATGNGSSTTDFDFGNSVIRLSPDLGVLDFFAPTNWAELSEHDTDLGSLAPAQLSSELIFQIGKEGIGYLLSAANLGGIGGDVFNARVCANSTNAAFGGVAFAPPYIYVPCIEGVVAVQVDFAARTFTVSWRGPSFTAGSPVVVGGLVWSVDRGGTLHALTPDTGSEVFTDPLGSPITSFPSLATANGRLVVPSGTNLSTYVLVPGTAAARQRPTVAARCRPATTVQPAAATHPPVVHAASAAHQRAISALHVTQGCARPRR